MRGHKNRSPGCPATNKALERRLKCPKTTYKHYGTLPLGSTEHHGPVKIEPCQSCPFSAKFALQNCPNPCGTVLGGPQNWVVGVPARERVIESLLKYPKGPHNHYGTLPWGPRGTLDVAKSEKKQPKQGKTPYQTRTPARGTFFCDPKTRLRGSLWATKCLDASYSVPGHHTITMGPHLGVPRAPWVRQNRKKTRISPVSAPRVKTQVLGLKSRKRRKTQIPPKGGRFSETFL